MGRTIALLLTLVSVLASCASTSQTGVPVTTNLAPAREAFLEGREQEDRFHREEAARLYQVATTHDPDFALAWLHLAMTSSSSQDRDKAMARALDARGKVSDAERMMIDATVAEERGQLAEAQRLRQELVRQFPQDGRVRYQLGMAYWNTDNEESIGHLEKSVELDRELDVAYNMLGYAYSNVGRHQDAVRAHRSYVRLLPKEPKAHDSLAETLMKAGSFGESIREFEKALVLDPTFVWSRMGIGHDLLFQGKLVEAGQAYERALTEAKTPQHKYQAADWLVVLGVYAADPIAALRAADRAIALARDVGDVEVAWATRNRARVELLSGKPEDAEATARKAVEAIPADAADTTRDDVVQSALRLQVETRIAMKDLEGARSVLAQLASMTQASKNAWHDKLYRFTEGFLRLAEGDAKTAAAALAKATQSDPRVLFHLGEANAALGKKLNAHRLYRRVERWNAPSLSHAMVYDKAKKRLAE